MQQSTALFLVAGALLAGCSAQSGSRKQAQGQAESVRVGVYDSRAIAVAYAGSAVHEEQISRLKAEHERAKADGDEARLRQLQANAQAQQKLLHKQGFSTAPVDNILERIKERLPAIARAAGVGPVVSKWDKVALSQYKSAEQVDVTMLLVRELRPSAQQLERAKAIQQQRPIPLRKIDQVLAAEDH